MRVLWRAGPPLLALGIICTGCSQSSDGPPKPGGPVVARIPDQTKPAAPKDVDPKAEDKSTGKAAELLPAGTEVVLTVEGMACRVS
jgi:hypothetical protein